MKLARLDFLDWLKCLGILLIVLGHVAARWLEPLAPPIYPKQLGVAFFLFASGFSLARERRPTRQVLFNRLFELFLFGIPFALLMSAVTYAESSRLALSNYLPFAFGANVVLDNFPSNPTTWFIGAYIHILLLWALFVRGRRIGPGVLMLTAAAEIVLRAALAQAGGLYVAYMMFPNWATVFLLGVFHGQREHTPERDGPWLWTALLGVLAIAWPVLGGLATRGDSFPFMVFDVGSTPLNLAATSAAVTFVYVGYTYLVYRVACWLPGSAVVRFFARNTVFIFIAHMPVFFALIPPLQAWTDQFWLRATIWFLVCSLGLALVSEGIRRLMRPERLRERVWRMLAERGTEAGALAHAANPAAAR
ncbi:MAG: acyltransferase [Gemmataceae bacterium]|nr:acyltransferase [Gemmataceae bacterium]